MNSEPTTRRDRHGAVSVVIPAYRSPGTLRRVCVELDAHVAPIVDELEVIFVDDGSGDRTWETICELSSEFSWVSGMTLLRNFGQHNALLAGLRTARFPVIVTMDDDLQNPPSEIPVLLEALVDDVDLVYGTPRTERQGVARNVASRSTKRLMALALGAGVHPNASSFRVFRRELVRASDTVQDPSISIDVLLAWGTSRIVAVEVDQAPRVAGASGYSFSRLTRHALTMVTGYSVRPLRFVGFVGLLVAGFGFALFAYVLATYLLGDSSVQGFTFVAAAITLFSGVQLVSLGVIGEYLGRVHFRTMGRPAYVIRDRTSHNPEPDPQETRNHGFHRP